MANLPPGTTPGDIDEHFGPPAMRDVAGRVVFTTADGERETVNCAVRVPEHYDDREIRRELRNEAAESAVGAPVETEIVGEL